VLDETLVTVVVDGELVLVAALTGCGEGGHRAFLSHHKANATAFKTTGKTA